MRKKDIYFLPFQQISFLLGPPELHQGSENDHHNTNSKEDENASNMFNIQGRRNRMVFIL